MRDTCRLPPVVVASHFRHDATERVRRKVWITWSWETLFASIALLVAATRGRIRDPEIKHKARSLYESRDHHHQQGQHSHPTA